MADYTEEDIQVTYIYSACCILKTKDVSVLCDPWFTEGAYDGSWFHYPKINNPVEVIGDVDYIYISHIHPDHYDPEFLRLYMKKFGKKKLIISKRDNNYLEKKALFDGFEIFNNTNEILIGDTYIQVVPHNTGSLSDIDSLIILIKKNSNSNYCVVNANDVIFDEGLYKYFDDLRLNIDILLTGYTGAGPYPQTYYELDDPKIIEKSNKKKKEFFSRYLSTINRLNSKRNIPFAGKYMLGGYLAELNEFRGVADPIEIVSIDPNAVILSDFGGHISASNLIPSKVRSDKYLPENDDNFIIPLRDKKMDYEILFDKELIKKVPYQRLLNSSYRNAIKKSEANNDLFLGIYYLNKSEMAVMNINKNNPSIKFIKNKNIDIPLPYVKIEVDDRYLFGLLTNIFHWDNAEIGSHLKVRREPDFYFKAVPRFLNFLSL